MIPKNKQVTSSYLAKLSMGYSPVDALKKMKDSGATAEDYSDILNSYKQGNYKSHLDAGTLDDYNYGLLKDSKISQPDFTGYLNKVYGTDTVRPSGNTGTKAYVLNGQIRNSDTNNVLGTTANLSSPDGAQSISDLYPNRTQLDSNVSIRKGGESTYSPSGLFGETNTSPSLAVTTPSESEGIAQNTNTSIPLTENTLPGNESISQNTNNESTQKIQIPFSVPQPQDQNASFEQQKLVTNNTNAENSYSVTAPDGSVITPKSFTPEQTAQWQNASQGDLFNGFNDLISKGWDSQSIIKLAQMIGIPKEKLSITLSDGTPVSITDFTKDQIDSYATIDDSQLAIKYRDLINQGYTRDDVIGLARIIGIDPSRLPVDTEGGSPVSGDNFPGSDNPNTLDDGTVIDENTFTPDQVNYYKSLSPDQIKAEYDRLINEGRSPSDIIKLMDAVGIDPTLLSFTNNTPPPPNGLLQPDSLLQPDQANPTLYSIDPSTQTVAGQLNGLLSSDSPYIQMARQRAMEQSNIRGVANSGLAAMAGERAAIESAMPIAQQDASTYYNQANLNQAAENTYGLQNSKNQWDDYFKQVDFKNDSALQRQKDLSAYDRAKLSEDGANYRAELTKDLNVDKLSADNQSRMTGYIDSAMSDFQTQYAALMTDPDLANDPNLPAMLDFLTTNTKNKLLSQATVLGIKDFSVDGLGLPTIANTDSDTASVVSRLRAEIAALPATDRDAFSSELLSQMNALPAADKATIENMLGISLANTDAAGLFNAFMGTLNA